MIWLPGNDTKQYYLGHLFINRPTRRPNTAIDANVALNLLRPSNAKKPETLLLDCAQRDPRALHEPQDTLFYCSVARGDRTQHLSRVFSSFKGFDALVGIMPTSTADGPSVALSCMLQFCVSAAKQELTDPMCSREQLLGKGRCWCRSFAGSHACCETNMR